jgi:hypothetical protein
MTACVADAHAHVQRLVLVVKLATVLEVRTTEEQRFYGQKESVQRIFIQKCFLFMVGSVCRVKRFTSGQRNVANVSLMAKRLKQTEVRKWLRHQPEDFCDAG